MNCNQCQETMGGIACNKKIGVCGKTESVALLQDLLIYSVKNLAKTIKDRGISVQSLETTNQDMVKALFMTITNANFDEEAIIKQIKIINEKRISITGEDHVCNAPKEMMLDLAEKIGKMEEQDEDLRSLKNFALYGIKGMAAYLEHAANLGREDNDLYDFMYRALGGLMEKQTGDELLALLMETGEYGVKAMALLDEANTSVYGNPEISKVNIGVRNNPAILVTGHDLKDLEMLLEQTAGTGVDVYTHGEMLPAHYYPFFKKYENFAGNYGNAWWKQQEEFGSFNGPVLFTTNCIVPPRKKDILARLFTTGGSGYPGAKHISADAEGHKDFSEIIKMAQELPAPLEIETGEIIGGFAHNQVFALADTVVENIKNGSIRKFVVMAGCDGRMKSRSYYTEFAEKLPQDTVILTAGCAKYRYNKLKLGDINGIPRVLDAGQCNDSYSLALIALKLKEAFALTDVNDLPIFYNISWYEQKAVIVLLALLSLGVKNIHLGPTLPGFLSENVKNALVEKFGIAGIQDVEKDIEDFVGISVDVDKTA